MEVGDYYLHGARLKKEKSGELKVGKKEGHDLVFIYYQIIYLYVNARQKASFVRNGGIGYGHFTVRGGTSSSKV